HARRAVVFSAQLERRRMERVDAVAARCGEAEMQARCWIGHDRPLGLADPKLHAVAPVAKAADALAQARISERLERGIIEALGAAGVYNANGNVIEHVLLLQISVGGRGGRPGCSEARPIAIQLRRAWNSACSCQLLPSSSEHSPSQRKVSAVMSVKLQHSVIPASFFPICTMSLPCARPS